MRAEGSSEPANRSSIDHGFSTAGDFSTSTLRGIVGRAGNSPDAAAIEQATAQLAELIARVEAAASDAQRDESEVLAPAGSSVSGAQPSLSERYSGSDSTAELEPTYAPGSALEVLARIVNVHGNALRGEPGGPTRKAALAEAAAGMPGLNDELERYIVSLIEPRIAEDGTVTFTFPGFGEFRADYDSGSGVLAIRRGAGEVRVRLEDHLLLDDGLRLEDRVPMEDRVSGAVDGEARSRLTWDRLIGALRSMFDDTRVWYVIVPMLFFSMLIVRDGSAEVRARRRRRRAASKVRGLGTSDDTLRSSTLAVDETLDGAETDDHGGMRRKRRRPKVTPKLPKPQGKPKSPGFFGTLMRSLGLKRDTPGRQVPLGGEKRSHRRRRKHRSHRTSAT